MAEKTRPQRKMRRETDSMGAVEVPVEVLFGAATQRAVSNFPISGRPLPVRLIRSYALLKRACAEVNRELGRLDPDRAELIVAACDEIVSALDDGGDREAAMMRNFPVDVFQTGSGTSTNTNLNEVVANLASRTAGRPLGSHDPVHPNDHVNLGQSSNDTFPTAMQVAAAQALRFELRPALKRLERTLERKSRKWDRVVKVGRTHLQDATPIRVGQEFGAFAAQTRFCVERAERACALLAESLPIGGTAVGTGFHADRRFGSRVARKLSRAVRLKLREALNHVAAQATRDVVVAASGEMRAVAVSLSKIANDLRWLASGPRCGLGELVLPATQPGSSMMPGKVNPVLCESLVQVCCQVVANDTAVALGAFGGVGSILQLNVAMPLLADSLVGSIELLTRAVEAFTERCVRGIELDEDAVGAAVERSLMLGTALVPALGYDAAAALVKEAWQSGATIREQVLARGLLEEKELDRLLDVRAMTEPE